MNTEIELLITYYATTVHVGLGKQFYNATFLKLIFYPPYAHGTWPSQSLNPGAHIKFVHVTTGSNSSANILGQLIIGNRCILFEN